MRIPTTRPPIRRLHWLDVRLREPTGVSLEDFCATFEISPRTAYRDIEYLRDQMNLTIHYDRRRKSYYYPDRNYPPPAVRLTEGELVALLLAEKVLQAYQGTRYASDLHAAFEKLCLALPEEITLELGSLGEAFSFDLGPSRPVDPNICATLVNAVRRRQRLEITYYTQSRDEVTTRQVDPLHLHASAGDLYLIAFCHLRGSVRDFAVSRIRQLKETDEYFTPPLDFDREAYLRQGFGLLKGGVPQNVAIWFDPYQARWIRERRWHSTQRIEELADGGLILHLTVPLTYDVIRWVLSYGSHCRVLAPEELARQVREEIAKMCVD